MTPVALSPSAFRDIGNKCMVFDTAFLNSTLVSRIRNLDLLETKEIGEPAILLDLISDNGTVQELILNPFAFKLSNKYYEPDLEIMNEVHLACSTGMFLSVSNDGIIYLSKQHE